MLDRIKQLLRNKSNRDIAGAENKVDIHTPIYWTLSWIGTVELGFVDGKYLPRKAALLIYPDYFDENGEPILDKLPIDSKELSAKYRF